MGQLSSTGSGRAKTIFFWSATSTLSGNGNVIYAKLKSFLSLVINKHDNLDEPLYNKCNHGEIKHRTWLDKGEFNFKVHLTPKYFFRLNTSLHLFKMHCTFLSLFNPNLDFLQAVKVAKYGHLLFHDRVIKRYGSIPGLISVTSSQE